MGRPPLPVGTYGEIKTKWDGSRGMASCQFRDLDGKVRKVRAWAQSPSKAANKLRERLRDRKISMGELSAESKVVDVAERWLSEFRDMVDAGKRSGTSYDTYEHRWRTLVKPRVVGLSVMELTTGRVDKIIQDIDGEYSASTARTCRAVVSGICGLAVRHGALSVNPVREARPVENGKRKKRPRALTVEEAIKIFETADGDEVARRHDLPDIMRYFAGTGTRTGETLAIRWETIDFDEKIAWVESNAIRSKLTGRTVNDGKTNNAERGIPMADWLVEMLLDRRARVAAMVGVEPEEMCGWVFPSTTGTLRENSNMRRDWRAFRDRHKIGDWFTPRTFRRTVATVLTDELPAREAADILGHSRVSQTTDTYVGRNLVSRHAAAVLNALGKTAEKRQDDQ
ncbi:site-specific integrase [Prauserella rugosa]|uniref:Site-specific recombinase XerC n=1 Tax=Prauserella rugosa TaxID=43354 RepID=A0A660CCI5_9PSEU|nr:tyrosine-type recombinase/integrase [Prauserella rugosa]TWH18545.1 site-specific recombinase XerC [Prauserella rugosa]